MNVGDEVICKHNGPIKNVRINVVSVEQKLTIGKSYVVKDYRIDGDGDIYIKMTSDDGFDNEYLSIRFKTLNEIRLEKLNELGLNKE